MDISAIGFDKQSFRQNVNVLYQFKHTNVLHLSNIYFQKRKLMNSCM